MGFGIMVRDNRGHVLAATSVMKRGFLGPTATEMMAVFIAVRFSFEKGFHFIILEGDAKNVLKRFNPRHVMTAGMIKLLMTFLWF